MNGHSKVTSPVADRGETGSDSAVGKALVDLRFTTFGRITVSLPLVSLIVCFVSAVVFQYEHVSKTDTCSHVPNMVPSISAITGVTPQRYIWRMCIALHCAPRFIIGFIYWYYYVGRLVRMAPGNERLYRALADAIFYVYTVENAALCGVTFIANVENYPVHEKIFIVFMITSLLHQLLTIIMFRWSHPDMQALPRIARSFKTKCICFAFISAFTSGLLYFYFMHRWYCRPGAFSMFSSCEYGIAISNILFHYTAAEDFHDLSWSVRPVKCATTALTNNHQHAVESDKQKQQ